MKVLFKGKDGGPESSVVGYWLFESKRFGSIVLLRFDRGTRPVFHNHAFNAISWVLSGAVFEEVLNDNHGTSDYLLPSIFPIVTKRERFHKVEGILDRTWILSFRGPWSKTWKEYFPEESKFITLTHGRKQVD